MSEECTKTDCESCGEGGCAHRKSAPAKEAANVGSRVKHMIAVISGKGGVGKSTVTALLANAVKRMGKNSAILDADITGPSIPKSFGLSEHAMGTGEYLLPVTTATGLQIMSINLILENETEPVVWRGPVIAGAVTQFWTDVLWTDVDYMFVDMPPGTGDVPLTVFQSLPVDGVIIVTTPQDLVGMIVAKAVNMAGMMNVPVLGLVENMSYFVCPDCGKRHEIFGRSQAGDIAAAFRVPHTARIPIDPSITARVDAGEIEQVDGSFVAGLAGSLEEMLPITEKS